MPLRVSEKTHDDLSQPGAIALEAPSESGVTFEKQVDVASFESVTEDVLDLVHDLNDVEGNVFGNEVVRVIKEVVDPVFIAEKLFLD